MGDSQGRSPAIGLCRHRDETGLCPGLSGVLVLHLRSSVHVVVVDGTQGWGELPEARRGSTARWVCFSREWTGGTTARHSDIPALGPWDVNIHVVGQVMGSGAVWEV